MHVFAMGAQGVHSYPGADGRAIVPQHFDLKTDPDWNWLAPTLKQELPQQPKGSTTTFTHFDLRQLGFRQLDLPESRRYWSQRRRTAKSRLTRVARTRWRRGRRGSVAMLP